MEIHRELGKGHDEIIYKDALVVELSRAVIPFLREKNYEITYKGVILPHYYLCGLCGGLLVNFGGDSLEWKRVVL
jgi:GxxExxY protein